MNKRIKELVEKLGPNPVATIGNWGRVEWADNVYPQLGDKMHASMDLEKFAELIIKECIECLDKQHVDIPDDADLEDNKTWISATINSTVNGCIGKIKQQFGVEV